MKLRDVMERIRFETATPHDLTGKAANNLFSNKNIIQQMKFALDRYASYTLAIEAIYSVPMSTTVQTIQMPSDALRSQTFRFIWTRIGGRIYPIDITDTNRVFVNFPYQPITGIPTMGLAWGDELYFFPSNSTPFITTELSSPISLTDTVISVNDGSGLPNFYGRVTIGDEKIAYRTRDGNQLLDCKRGVENTTPAAASFGDEVQENNVFIFYRKKHFEIPVYDNDIIDEYWLNKEMEVWDEHMEVICQYTSSKLLRVIDRQESNDLDEKWKTWLEQAREDVMVGRSDINRTSNIREPYLFELMEPFVPL